MPNFSDRLRDLRHENEYSLNFMANELGISSRTLINYENDKVEPTMSKIIALANFFDVSTDYLLGVSDSKNLEDTSNLNEIAESLASIKNRSIILEIIDHLKEIDAHHKDSANIKVIGESYLKYLNFIAEAFKIEFIEFVNVQDFLKTSSSEIPAIEEFALILAFLDSSKERCVLCQSAISKLFDKNSEVSKEFLRIIEISKSLKDTPVHLRAASGLTEDTDMDAVARDLDKLKKSIEDKKTHQKNNSN